MTKTTDNRLDHLEELMDDSPCEKVVIIFKIAPAVSEVITTNAKGSPDNECDGQALIAGIPPHGRGLTINKLPGESWEEFEQRVEVEGEAHYQYQLKDNLYKKKRGTV